MKSNMVSKGIAAIGALGVAAGLLVTTAPPAPAAAPVIVAVGAHATEDVMAKLFLGTGVFNIQAQPVSPVTVPADTISCQTSVTYAQSPISAGQTLAPNGGNLGRDALKQGSPYNTAAPNNGCVSIARSSSGPRKAGSASGQDPATYQYYTFAMDAVTWASPSLNAPAVLTPAQILGIYNCTFTNWAQVGGGSGPIQRYEPQPGAATRSFFETAFLGGLDPTTISTPSCPAVITTAADGGPLDESVGTELDAVNYQKAILPYDTAEWSFQANNSINPTIDERAGVIAHGVVATRKANNFTSISDGTTTSGSTTVGSGGSNFTASEVGAPISGTGIPSGDVIQSVAGDNSSAVLASTGVTRTVTDGATHKTVTQVNTTTGSTTISINGGSSTFSAADVGAKLSIPTSGGNGIQDGTTIASFVDATHVTISAPATGTNNGTIVPANAITLNLNGGSKAVSSVNANFVTGDVGKVISGGSLPAAAHHHRHQRRRHDRLHLHRGHCRQLDGEHVGDRRSQGHRHRFGHQVLDRHQRHGQRLDHADDDQRPVQQLRHRRHRDRRWRPGRHDADRGVGQHGHPVAGGQLGLDHDRDRHRPERERPVLDERRGVGVQHHERPAGPTRPGG